MLHALRMACLQMELSIVIDVVMYVVYCVTVVLGGGVRREDSLL